LPAPGTTALAPAAPSIKQLPVAAMAVSVAPPLTVNVPPLTLKELVVLVSVLLPAPKVADPAFTFRTPKLLAPVRVSVPVPALVSVPLPEIAPAKLVEELSVPIVNVPPPSRTVPP